MLEPKVRIIDDLGSLKSRFPASSHSRWGHEWPHTSYSVHTNAEASHSIAIGFYLWTRPSHAVYDGYVEKGMLANTNSMQALKSKPRGMAGICPFKLPWLDRACR
jgi:hypothetical protein